MCRNSGDISNRAQAPRSCLVEQTSIILALRNGEGDGVWRWGWRREAIQREVEVPIPQG